MEFISGKFTEEGESTDPEGRGSMEEVNMSKELNNLW